MKMSLIAPQKAQSREELLANSEKKVKAEERAVTLNSERQRHSCYLTLIS